MIGWVFPNTFSSQFTVSLFASNPMYFFKGEQTGGVHEVFAWEVSHMPLDALSVMSTHFCPQAHPKDTLFGHFKNVFST